MKRRARTFALLLASLVLLCRHACAHDSGAVHARLRIDGTRIAVELDLARSDALGLLSLPRDLDDDHGIPLILSRAPELSERARDGLALLAQGKPCRSSSASPGVERGRNPGIVLVRLTAECGVSIRNVSVEVPLLLALGPQSRAFVGLDDGTATFSAVVGAPPRRTLFTLEHHRLAEFAAYVREGVRHVSGGLDHLLFLAALLLPAALIRSNGRWEPRQRARQVLVEVALVASAFTVAHSITLCAAALDIVRPPRRWVEAAIATTVLIAALNNVGGFLRVRGYQLAFVLGLVHGFGFAAQLGILRLRPLSRVVALLGFNVGVEVGQLLVIGACLPLLLSTRKSRFYLVGVLEVPSLLIAWVAGVWLFERAFGVTLLG